MNSFTIFTTSSILQFSDIISSNPASSSATKLLSSFISSTSFHVPNNESVELYYVLSCNDFDMDAILCNDTSKQSNSFSIASHLLFFLKAAMAIVKQTMYTSKSAPFLGISNCRIELNRLSHFSLLQRISTALFKSILSYTYSSVGSLQQTWLADNVIFQLDDT